jgi:hypothetical protein
MEETDEEIWKPITDFPNYEISSKGQVRNIITNTYLKILKNASGYNRCNLCNDLIHKTFLVHRLIAKEFINNPENKPTVDHIDKNRQNNCVSNLRWATHKEQNSNKNAPKRNYGNTLSIWRIDKNTNEKIELYNSLRDASEWIINNNLSKIKNNNYKSIMSKISSVAKNNKHCNTSFGYKWSYKEEIKEEDEIWKEISTTSSEKYSVSSNGRIKPPNNHIKKCFCKSNGYYVVSINSKFFYVHRLVALTFLENTENKECVNHIDGNKLNNELTNLEWATSLENNLHKINNGLSNWTKKVIQYDTNMNKINEFNSIADAARFLNIGKNCISANCSGKYKTTKCGFLFRYAE